MQATRYETRVGIFVLVAACMFAYLAIHIGAFRFDTHKYHTYTLYFQDIAGLSRKSDVKIAGVTVGWVDHIALIGQQHMQAQLIIKVAKNYAMYEDAQGIIKQDGLLGHKYLELQPGNPHFLKLENYATLAPPRVQPTSLDELMMQCKNIAQHVESVTATLHDVFGAHESKHDMHSIVHNLSTTTEHLATFSERLQGIFSDNEQQIQHLLEIGSHVQRLSEALTNETIPHIQEAAACVSSITRKVHDGQGLLGQLVNDEQAYRDIQVATQGLRNYFTTIDKMQVVCDTHFESMLRPAENYDFEDSKGYFDVKLYPKPDYFFLLQIVGSEKGYVNRYEVTPSYIDCEGYYVDTKNIDLTDEQRLKLTYTRKNDIFTRGAVRFGLQLGKIFNNIAFRLGMFENSVGGAFDINVPICPESLRWVSSFEAFDFRGWNRRDDRRPHLKWLNRMFFLRNLYISFGADDFISKRNANIFFGGGLRFGDDEMKYMLGMLSGMGAAGGGGLAQVIAVNN